MPYTAIGKEVWDDLPGLFDDPATAGTLTSNKCYWCYTYMIPSDALVGTMITMEAGISYSKLTGRFSKYVQIVNEV
jgi:hypothetical protein